MATEVASRQVVPPLPLYRMDIGTYNRLVEAGALEGVEVELLGGLLIDKHSQSEDAIHRLDTETYNRMVETGALEGEPVELLDGLLVEVSPQGTSHHVAIIRLTRYLGAARAWLSVQGPLEIRPRSEPEPDLMLIEGEPSVKHHPRAAVLAVEVSVTSRFFTGGTRRAIELRDRECTNEYCDVRADRCQGDHVITFTEGGLTDQENGRVLCGFHNRLRNQRPPPQD